MAPMQRRCRRRRCESRPSTPATDDVIADRFYYLRYLLRCSHTVLQTQYVDRDLRLLPRHCRTTPSDTANAARLPLGAFDFTSFNYPCRNPPTTCCNHTANTTLMTTTCSWLPIRFGNHEHQQCHNDAWLRGGLRLPFYTSWQRRRHPRPRNAPRLREPPTGVIRDPVN